MLMTVNSRFRKIVPALLASFAIASAGGSAARDLRSLVGESDAVVVGRVVEGSTTPPAARLTIEVERALKGDAAQRAVLTATWVAPAGQQVFGGRVVLERGLFFLHRDGATWRIIPTASGSVSHVSSTYVPLPAYPTTVIEPSADPLEAVFLELAASIENGGARPGGGMVFDLAAQYRSAPTPTLKTVFQRFATSPTPRLRSLGQRALLGTGDLGTLAAVEQQQASLTPAELGQLARVITSDFRSSDPQAVASLAA